MTTSLRKTGFSNTANRKNLIAALKAFGFENETEIYRNNWVKSITLNGNTVLITVFENEHSETIYNEQTWGISFGNDEDPAIESFDIESMDDVLYYLLKAKEFLKF
jgi:hypothetical protein